MKKLAEFDWAREAGGDFLAALSFLSVLAPPVEGSSNKFGRALVWFGAAGFLIGALSSAGAAIFCLVLRALSSAPEILIALFGGWTWICIEIFLTRGLHWDGIADLGDGLGSGARGDKFWIILKDSRLGTFGALALFLLVMGDAILASAHLLEALAADALGQSFLLSLAPAWGRLAPIWMGARLKAWPHSGLGRMVCENISIGTRIGTALIAVAILVLAFASGTSAVGVVCLACAEAALILGLNRIASSRGGLSGDFFGAGIEVSQFLFIFFSLF